MNVRTKFEIRSFTRSRDRGTQKYGQSLDGSAPFRPIPFRPILSPNPNPTPNPNPNPNP